MRPRLAAAMSLALALGGCGDAPEPDAVPPPQGCDDPLSIARSDGTCFRPGVPLDGCGEGFVHDDGYGCEPLLPTEPCAPGLMAVPGDEQCRPVMDCGQGKWGNLPIDAATQYVDGAYSNMDSDGSEAKPWRTITEAIAAVAAGGLVAVAEGVYTETVALRGKPARVWGVCPDRVTIISPGPAPNCPAAGACIADGASGSEIGGMSMTGDFTGVVMSGSEDVLIDRVRVFDVGFRGIAAEAALGPTSFTLRDSLIEGATEFGIWTNGANVSIEGSVVRDTRPRPSDQHLGNGIIIQLFCVATNQCDPSLPITGHIHRSVIERNHELGLTVAGTDVALTDTVIRLTLPNAGSALFGRGIDVLSCSSDFGCSPSVGAHLTASGVLVERNYEAGLVNMGSDSSISASVFRDTYPTAADGLRGFAIAVQPSCDGMPGALVCDPGTRGTLSLRSSLVARSQEIGVAVTAADGDVDGSVVSGVTANAQDGLFGDGISVATQFFPATANVHASLVDDSARAGIANFGGEVSLSDTKVRCAAFALNGQDYDGASFTLNDGGGNSCGCPLANEQCVLVNAGLEVPSPLAPPDP